MIYNMFPRSHLVMPGCEVIVHRKRTVGSRFSEWVAVAEQLKMTAYLLAAVHGHPLTHLVSSTCPVKSAYIWPHEHGAVLASAAFLHVHTLPKCPIQVLFDVMVYDWLAGTATWTVYLSTPTRSTLSVTPSATTSRQEPLCPHLPPLPHPQPWRPRQLASLTSSRCRATHHLAH